MFTLCRLLPMRRLLGDQLPALALSWLLAELFYKFHSFSLETAAFLATWFALDALIQGLRRLAGHATAVSVER
ncbi:hypothetical protein [Caldimonas sp. KR1-144]|uniref:hypothetical protein n=1 Tax=Caldimonas sp. KR1-144 TaxID=3400911 RepID=UPI003C026E9C